MEEALTALVGAVASLLGYIGKSWWDERQKARQDKRTQERARELLADEGNGIRTSTQAVEVATLEAQTARITEQARKVRESMTPPVSPTVPRLDIDITPVSAPALAPDYLREDSTRKKG